MVYKKRNVSRRRRSNKPTRRKSKRSGKPRRKSRSRRKPKRRRKIRRKSICRRGKKSKRRSKRRSKRKRSKKFKKPVYKSVKKSTKLSTPLKIYTAPGCPACTEVKEMCKKKGIKFKCYNRRDHSEYVKKNTGNCRYVPNVFNSNGQYIGGNDDLTKLTKNITVPCSS
jgi:glutaredoxin